MHFFHHFNFSQEVGHFHESLNYLLDVLVHIYYLGNDPLYDLDGGRGEDNFWLLFVLVDFWYFLHNWHKLLDVVRDLFYLVNSRIYGYYLLLESLDLLDLPLDVWLRNLLELILLLHVDFLLNLRDYLGLSLYN
jgi:hypothetical protein